MLQNTSSELFSTVFYCAHRKGECKNDTQGFFWWRYSGACMQQQHPSSSSQENGLAKSLCKVTLSTIHQSGYTTRAHSLKGRCKISTFFCPACLCTNVRHSNLGMKIYFKQKGRFMTSTPAPK